MGKGNDHGKKGRDGRESNPKQKNSAAGGGWQAAYEKHYHEEVPEELADLDLVEIMALVNCYVAMAPLTATITQPPFYPLQRELWDRGGRSCRYAQRKAPQVDLWILLSTNQPPAFRTSFAFSSYRRHHSLIVNG
ncbi:hypothetical protein QOT17_014114 [Balamuthia mandrillaris]